MEHRKFAVGLKVSGMMILQICSSEQVILLCFISGGKGKKFKSAIVVNFFNGCTGNIHKVFKAFIAQSYSVFIG